MGAWGARAGQGAGDGFPGLPTSSAVLDPCSVGLTLCSMTQADGCFYYPHTHACTQTHSHPNPHMFPRPAQEAQTGGMSRLCHIFSCHLGPVWDQDNQSLLLCLTVNFPSGTLVNLSCQPFSRFPVIHSLTSRFKTRGLGILTPSRE